MKQKGSVNLQKCPFCNHPHNVIFVEVSTLYIDNGIAVECVNCGTRSMAADAEEKAAEFWNDMQKA